MAGPSRSNAAWERVLAAVEAEANRAAALLVDDDSEARAGIEYDGHDALPPPASAAELPATWRLPSKTDLDNAELPNVADMPPIPPHLRERIVQLNARITALKKDLAAAMAEARHAMSKPGPRRPEPEARPELVDKRV